MMNYYDSFWMKEALLEARKAFKLGEVPVGAVAVKDNKIIGKAHNLRETTNDPTAHAEILLLKQVSNLLGRWRLKNIKIYVTLEPCLMCTGALVLSRVSSLFFGAYDPKAGAVVSLYNILEDKRLNHSLPFEGGVLLEECSLLLRDFFKAKRNNT